MVRWRSGTVAAVRRRWRGAVELDVDVSDLGAVRALAYPALVGEPAPGDRVLLNVGALRHGPGHRRVRARGRAARPAAARPAVDGATRDDGHLVKARYTPLQAIVLGADEEASPHRAVLAAADDLDGMPVVTADLHSALPAILAGVRADAPGRPGRLRDDRRRRAAGLVLPHPRRAAPTGSPARSPSGQAFGGDLEATNVHSGLLAARHVLGADVAVVAQGPGNLGTGTRVGLLRRRGRRGGQRGRRAGRPAGRLAAHLRRRPAAPPPRACRTTASPRTAGSRSPPADLVVPAGLDAGAGRGWSRRRWRRCARRHRIVEVATRRAGRGAARRCRCRCRRWAAASTPTTPTSWPPRPPAGTPPPCSLTR